MSASSAAHCSDRMTSPRSAWRCRSRSVAFSSCFSPLVRTSVCVVIRLPKGVCLSEYYGAKRQRRGGSLTVALDRGNQLRHHVHRAHRLPQVHLEGTRCFFSKRSALASFHDERVSSHAFISSFIDLPSCPRPSYTPITT